MSQPTITAELQAIDSPVAKELIAEVQAEYVVRYGGPDDTPVNPREFAGPEGAFMVLSVDGEPAGMVGLRRHNDDDVEVKRMFVRSTFRGLGLARQLMSWAEDKARELGYQRIILETGMAQPEAMGLYESSGYQTIPGFGYYKDSPENRCYAKSLVS